MAEAPARRSLSCGWRSACSADMDSYNKIRICCKNSLAIQNVVVSSSSLPLWNVAKIFFATDPLRTTTSDTNGQSPLIRSVEVIFLDRRVELNGFKEIALRRAAEDRRPVRVKPQLVARIFVGPLGVAVEALTFGHAQSPVLRPRL